MDGIGIRSEGRANLTGTRAIPRIEGLCTRGRAHARFEFDRGRTSGSSPAVGQLKSEPSAVADGSCYGTARASERVATSSRRIDRDYPLAGASGSVTITTPQMMQTQNALNTGS